MAARKKKSTAAIHPRHVDLDVIARVANNPVREQGFTRTYYSYPAKFLAQLPRTLIEMLTVERDTVVDPYCGGGTVGLECLLSGRRSFGYDLNPFAVFISRVKCTKLDTRLLHSYAANVLKPSGPIEVDVLDEVDKECLGVNVANEINTVTSNIRGLKATQSYKNFFRLALIHSIKIAGRRDFPADTDSNGLFLPLAGIAEESLRGILQKKIRKMIEQMHELPNARYPARFFCQSNYHMHQLHARSADLIVTSPPYKDVDVEYSLLQIQRPDLNRSKRSNVINKIINVSPPNKVALCGGKGEGYWSSLQPTLKESYRVLKTGRYAFFWTGFKSDADRCTFEENCWTSGFELIASVPATLSDDRVASSRSTHHERDTGMMSKDYLFVCRKP